MKRIFLPQVFLLLFFLVSCSTEPVSRDWKLMGTVVTLTLFDNPDRSLFEQSRQIILEIEEKMTNWNDESEISQVNLKAGQSPVRVSEDTLEVLQTALAMARLSRGAFDPTIGPVVKLWGITTETPQVPDSEELKETLQLVGWEKVGIQENQVYLPLAGMELDLGAIAKGYAADRVAEFLRSRGVDSAILNFGGNVYVLGEKDSGEPWRIGVQDPGKYRSQLLGVSEIGEISMVTSGTYERYFQDPETQKIYHHIFDPKMGYPVENGLLSVTILSPNSMLADGLSTSVFVLGMEQGMELLRDIEGVSAILVTDDSIVHTLGDPPFELINTLEYRMATEN